MFTPISYCPRSCANGRQMEEEESDLGQSYLDGVGQETESQRVRSTLWYAAGEIHLLPFLCLISTCVHTLQGFVNYGKRPRERLNFSYGLALYQWTAHCQGHVGDDVCIFRIYFQYSFPRTDHHHRDSITAGYNDGGWQNAHPKSTRNGKHWNEWHSFFGKYDQSTDTHEASLSDDSPGYFQKSGLVWIFRRFEHKQKSFGSISSSARDPPKGQRQKYSKIVTPSHPTTKQFFLPSRFLWWGGFPSPAFCWAWPNHTRK